MEVGVLFVGESVFQSMYSVKSLPAVNFLDLQYVEMQQDFR